MNSVLPTTFWGWVVFLVRHDAPMFLSGACVTKLVAVIGTAAGCVIGFFVGLIRARPRPPWPSA